MPGTEDDKHEDPVAEVIRSVTIDAPVDAVWDVVADPEQRDLWLDDEDARSRETRFDRVEHQQGLSWTWWRPGDDSSAAQVDITLVEVAPARTQVVVVERPAARASASASAASNWGHRLLGLELLFVAALVCVH